MNDILSISTALAEHVLFATYYTAKMIKYNMLPPLGRGSHVRLGTHNYLTCTLSADTRHMHLDISSRAPFSQFTTTASHSFPGDKLPGWWSVRTQEPSKNDSVRLDHLHMHQGSPLHYIFCAASTIIPLLPKAPSLHPSKPRSTPYPITSTINTMLTIRFSSIPSTCAHYPNTLRSTLLANSFLF